MTRFAHVFRAEGGGKKLYELAREGKTIERKSRRVMISGIRILEMDLPRIRMVVECSKGTYIRRCAMTSEKNSGAADVWSRCCVPA